MKLSYLEIENIKCFQEEITIPFSDSVNILVGPNNSGKSTILNCISLLQKSETKAIEVDQIKGVKSLKIGIKAEGDEYHINPENDAIISSFVNRDYIGYSYMDRARHPNYDLILYKSRYPFLWIDFAHPNGNQILASKYSGHANAEEIGTFVPFPNKSPYNLIFPFLSNRKSKVLSHTINLDASQKVDGTLEFLNAKIDQYQSDSRFHELCVDILGFKIDSVQSSKGKHTILRIDKQSEVPITEMGVGVINMLGLIVLLLDSEDKIFLIEEPENDIHPKALKAILKLIEESSIKNQFFISTHSNIVVRQLGANPLAKVLKITPENDYQSGDKKPRSSIQIVPNDPTSRLSILEDLGYDVYDFALWKGWLFLEESSAEELIREFFIPEFTPSLSYRLRTHSTRSIVEVESKFDDFNNLFVYIHRDQSYKNRAWVVVDAGTKESDNKENKVIEKMKEIYVGRHGWSANHFRQFSEHDFERYYPAEFQAEFDGILAISVPGNKKQERQDKKDAKAALLNKVKAWINEDRERAKEAFQQSAGEVIDLLKEIEVALS